MSKKYSSLISFSLIYRFTAFFMIPTSPIPSNFVLAGPQAGSLFAPHPHCSLSSQPHSHDATITHSYYPFVFSQQLSTRPQFRSRLSCCVRSFHSFFLTQPFPSSEPVSFLSFYSLSLSRPNFYLDDHKRVSFR
jgi:hypothetical protein